MYVINWKTWQGVKVISQSLFFCIDGPNFQTDCSICVLHFFSGQMSISKNTVDGCAFSSQVNFFYSLFILQGGPAGGGGPTSPVWILKRLVSVFINACRLLSALSSLSQFGRGRLSLVVIPLYTLSLLFGPCRLSEFTLAGLLQELSLDSLSGNTVRNN